MAPKYPVGALNREGRLDRALWMDARLSMLGDCDGAETRVERVGEGAIVVIVADFAELRDAGFVI